MGNYLGTYNVINSELKKNIGCEFTVTISPNEIRKKHFLHRIWAWKSNSQMKVNAI